MGSSESKPTRQQEEAYALLMKNPSMIAALETLEIDKPTTGFRFYRLFAAMDADKSKSIDLEEFHRYFQLPHTTFSNLVFSNMGKQTPVRGLPFDDFVLNLWNFCTMSPTDLYVHVFRLYDDDHNGTLDAAEYESLFRLLYHTENLPNAVKKQLKAMTAEHDGVITLDSFLKVCSRKRSLFKPIFHLQSRARAKSMGTRYWSNVSKTRQKLLNGRKDIFDVARTRLQFDPRPPVSPPYKVNSPIRDSKTASTVNPLDSRRDSASPPSATPDRLSAKMEPDDLDAWIKEESQKQPPVQVYLTAFSQAAVAECRLKKFPQNDTSLGRDQFLLDLRYNVAVSVKRRDEARAVLEEMWEEELSSLIAARHKVISSMVKSISTKTLHQQTGKKSAPKVVRSYTQKKLDLEESIIRKRFTERWQTLDRAAELSAQRELSASRHLSSSGNIQPKSVHLKSSTTHSDSNKSRVVPVANKYLVK